MEASVRLSLFSRRISGLTAQSRASKGKRSFRFTQEETDEEKKDRVAPVVVTRENKI